MHKELFIPNIWRRKEDRLDKQSHVQSEEKAEEIFVERFITAHRSSFLTMY